MAAKWQQMVGGVLPNCQKQHKTKNKYQKKTKNAKKILAPLFKNPTKLRMQNRAVLDQVPKLVRSTVIPTSTRPTVGGYLPLSVSALCPSTRLSRPARDAPTGRRRSPSSGTWCGVLGCRGFYPGVLALAHLLAPTRQEVTLIADDFNDPDLDCL